MEQQLRTLIKGYEKYYPTLLADKYPRVLQKIIDSWFADINASYQQGYTALHWAATSGSVDVVNLLLEQGSNPNLQSYHGFTPII
ncbi:MAG: hypothetical protein GQ582_08040 [Methyloprofundus sp.]|nr:hypothetical protein [Methyloprofundus sp.]